ncbi:MAG: FtsX-like permease family protein [Deltaproteobacteria bacterium]|nr:FtsX-like permease family protein [Deltaproteobacteria bacterium]MBW2306629.1 FtsX-like permease family protein [Deltaproteobacteria bacterium]
MRLPWSMVLKIAMASFQHRRMRTLITILSLSLAIAFLSYTLVCAELARCLRETGNKQVISKLDRMGYEVESAPEGQPVLLSKKIWIVALSLLVCVVGIINTQLMSVMEQYHVIGTMKCLGALDSIIFRILTMEALIQGLMGSVSGVIVGVALAFVNFSVPFGSYLYQNLDILSLTMWFSVSVLVGCALSFIGVAYPAIIVARMQPTEALRVDR